MLQRVGARWGEADGLWPRPDLKKHHRLAEGKLAARNLCNHPRSFAIRGGAHDQRTLACAWGPRSSSTLKALGVRLVVGQRTLNPYAEVRILDPQPEATGTPCGLPIQASPLS